MLPSRRDWAIRSPSFERTRTCEIASTRGTSRTCTTRASRHVNRLLYDPSILFEREKATRKTATKFPNSNTAATKLSRLLDQKRPPEMDAREDRSLLSLLSLQRRRIADRKSVELIPPTVNMIGVVSCPAGQRRLTQTYARSGEALIAQYITILSPFGEHLSSRKHNNNDHFEW